MILNLAAIHSVVLIKPYSPRVKQILPCHPSGWWGLFVPKTWRTTLTINRIDSDLGINTTAQGLASYRDELLELGFHAATVDELVRDAAYAVHRRELRVKSLTYRPDIDTAVNVGGHELPSPSAIVKTSFEEALAAFSSSINR
ncbi:hypothetical protein [Rhodococcus sp. (in: high G+C Gram-positive bacteria)]|uniref:hypothetical protein n=1 Tax=Rhodococcus sp. TaxID=1831 RepID=UPI001A18A48B|nr:hypothetical protein [Rhodococcus sp. (in: high G+C Gram-positive bacteria)]MBJ7480896.1 hypothetical protein [Rhodococcus sp. (in: high G+C Gram-positive bacteria)]